MPDPIRQPRNTSNLTWSANFARRYTTMFNNVQKYIDSECIRLMVKYTPARNNILYKSATVGTVIGGGHIYYQSPYARFQYYGKVMVSSVTGSSYARHGESKVLTDRDLKYSTARHLQAQKMWFETMKTNHKEQILRGTAAIINRR